MLPFPQNLSNKKKGRLNAKHADVDDKGVSRVEYVCIKCSCLMFIITMPLRLKFCFGSASVM